MNLYQAGRALHSQSQTNNDELYRLFSKVGVARFFWKSRTKGGSNQQRRAFSGIFEAG
jgi:hypothetical protein